MRLLLDTHVVLWAMVDSKTLSPQARALISEADAVYVSTVSLWEISIKAALGKLDLDCDVLVQRLEDAGFLPLQVTWAHAVNLRHLPPLHRDPFDRMLVAQALCEPLRLLTADSALTGYSELVTLI
ncbi:MAG: type II toxin-antitoxin system VapC family toxin [Dokdonella sp.]